MVFDFGKSSEWRVFSDRIDNCVDICCGAYGFSAQPLCSLIRDEVDGGF